MISTRAEALGRFMASYAKLARLPQPELGPVDVPALVRRVADLETRLPVDVVGGGRRHPPGRRGPARAGADQPRAQRGGRDAGGRRDGRVTIRWLARSGKLHILVEDEGPGLADTGNLFVPFYTTKPGGSGIGLVLSRQIAEGHGGSLVLESRGAGRGVRARLVLPTDLQA